MFTYLRRYTSKRFRRRRGDVTRQTARRVVLVDGAPSVAYIVRHRRRLWQRRPFLVRQTHTVRPEISAFLFSLFYTGRVKRRFRTKPIAARKSFCEMRVYFRRFLTRAIYGHGVGETCAGNRWFVHDRIVWKRRFFLKILLKTHSDILTRHETLH